MEGMEQGGAVELYCAVILDRSIILLFGIFGLQ